MMKKYFLLFILAFPVLLLAQSPEKLISKGEYDDAIEICVDKLEAGKGKKAELYASLKHAFEAANEINLNKILELKGSRQPAMWFDVFTNYADLQMRYISVSRISEMLTQDMVNIQLTDHSTDLEASRQNAAAYLYAHSVSLLKSGKKADAGQAYSELLLITKLYPDYQDVELLMRRAIGGSVNLARMEINNRSDASLSPDFIASMEDMALTYREKQYLDYIVKAEPGQHYSLVLAVDINSVDATPGTVNEKEYTASHKNPESYAATYDDPAKFEEDKKHPDFNKCKITEIYQIKTAVIKGKLKYIDQASGKVLYEIPITARSVFENKTATATGDMFACPPEISEILDKPKMKFPKSGEMITRAGKEFKILLKGIIWNDSFINN